MVEQWSLQGTIIAFIVAGAYETGVTLILWSAFAAWALTLWVPFLIGYAYHQKMY